MKHIQSVLKHLKYAIRSNKAFTLLEMLVNMAVVMIIISIIPMILIEIYQFNGRSTDHHDINTALFLREIATELKNAKDITVIDDKLQIALRTDLITYEYVHNRIVRKVNGEGYIIMLEDIKKGVFFIDDEHLYISLQSKNESHAKKYQVL